VRVLLAGSTGAIGLPVVRSLRADRHSVIGIAHSEHSGRVLAEADVESIIADALDAASVHDAVRRTRPEVIINEITALPKHYTPEEMRNAADRDRNTRVQANANLLAAAHAGGVKRYVLQSSAFWYAPGPGLADESAPFAFDASPGIAAGARTYASLEQSLAEVPGLAAIVLRYGFFYGPGTWYTKEGDMGQQVRNRQVPVVGEGQGVWNFVHVEDAATATGAGLHCTPGVYNILNDSPSEQHVWLPAFARWADAPEPPGITEHDALQSLGADAVYYATRLRGASNDKAKRELKFQPRPLEWLSFEHLARP
jgi:nucleoside-diphosphate-sugar epimerase